MEENLIIRCKNILKRTISPKKIDFELLTEIMSKEKDIKCETIQGRKSLFFVFKKKGK
jgi:hypothetical protein